MHTSFFPLPAAAELTELLLAPRATISLMHRFSVSQHKIISCTLLWTNCCYRMSLTLMRL